MKITEKRLRQIIREEAGRASKKKQIAHIRQTINSKAQAKVESSLVAETSAWEAAADGELDDHEHMLSMAEELAERTADNFLRELTELLSDGPRADYRFTLASKTVRRTILRTLRRTAADAMAIAYDLE